MHEFQAPRLGVAIVTCQASMRLGGEAALALNYFAGLLARGVPVYLVCHARARQELQALFPDHEARIFYVRDSLLQRALWRLGNLLPWHLANASTEVLLHWLTQRRQLPILRDLSQKGLIDLVHQPMPVSPREPSFIFDVGVPVIMGPMNGDMNYPPGFERREAWGVRALLRCGRMLSDGVNRWVPGKLKAQLLVVANARTRKALPAGLTGRIVELPENGVDLSQWPIKHGVQPPVNTHSGLTRFAFVGRLVPFKAADLLLRAFVRLTQLSDRPVRLSLVGDGPQRSACEQLAKSQGVWCDASHEGAGVSFHGWLSPSACSGFLRESDALVLPSLLECGGAVVLEAMASGLPVIAADWGGPAEYLDPACGVLVPVRNEASFVEAMAQAMLRLAEQAELRQRMGQQGRQKVVNHYAWPQKIDTMLGFYASVLAPSSACHRNEPPAH